MRGSSDDANVLELPRVLSVEIFGKQMLATVKGRPIATDPDHLAEIGSRDIENPLEIHFLRLDDAPTRMLKGPDGTGEHRGGDLQRGGVVVWRRPSRLSDRQAGAVPVDAP